jgi:hypothetical protein
VFVFVLCFVFTFDRQMRRLVGMVEVRLFDISRRNVDVGRMQAAARSPETAGDEGDGRSS